MVKLPACPPGHSLPSPSQTENATVVLGARPPRASRVRFGNLDPLKQAHQALRVVSGEAVVFRVMRVEPSEDRLRRRLPSGINWLSSRKPQSTSRESIHARKEGAGNPEEGSPSWLNGPADWCGVVLPDAITQPQTVGPRGFHARARSHWQDQSPGIARRCNLASVSCTQDRRTSC